MMSFFKNTIFLRITRIDDVKQIFKQSEYNNILVKILYKNLPKVWFLSNQEVIAFQLSL